MNTGKNCKTTLKRSYAAVSAHSTNRAKASVECIKIDYPEEGEVIRSEQYTFRISTAVPALRVEISLNGGNWQSCRESAGYWWFDWKKEKTKPKALHARVHDTNGSVHISEMRRFCISCSSGVPR